MTKKNVYFRTFYSFTQSGPRVYVNGSHVRSQRKRTYVLGVTRSFFLEWVGREMVTGIGHVKMGTGREEGGGLKGTEVEMERHEGGGEGGDRERARLVD